MTQLSGKVAIITGSASGVGAATASLMAERGASVVVADINRRGADDTVAAIAARGGRAIACEVDVREEDSVRAMVDLACATFGRLDVLHNNAAALGDDVLGRDLDLVSMTVELWDRTMAVSLRGVMLGCKYALPPMLDQGEGVILNTTSVAGQTGDVKRAAYGSAKAGVETLTKYVATMYGKQGVRCNAIAPGLIMSPPAIANLTPEMLDATLRNRLLQRAGTPADVAAMAAFLASDEAAFITGQTFNVDGGVLAHHPAYSQNVVIG
jgi:NAD(P)-dependent dehydrogenase (short-subunit alcohol dehydrogenase family)